MTGEIFDILRFTVHDGPGIRATAFLKGCPLECVWCHNPEGKHSGMEIAVLPLQCVACGACVRACPNNAISLENGDVALRRERCTRCGRCAKACAAGALIAKGREITPEELVNELLKDEVFFKASGGGVTLSGGDPLFQPEFTAQVLRLAKARGCHTALETCLFASEAVFGELLGLPDLWIVDLKHMDSAEHERLTGRSNAPILRNYARLAASKRPMLTRIPVIPGCTDSPANLTAIGEYIAATNPACEVELMFYNVLAEAKYKNYDFPYALAEAKAYTPERQSELRALVASKGVRVVG